MKTFKDALNKMCEMMPVTGRCRCLENRVAGTSPIYCSLSGALDDITNLICGMQSYWSVGHITPNARKHAYVITMMVEAAHGDSH